MKTRQELVLDFMIALAGNEHFTAEYEDFKTTAKDAYEQANWFAEIYLENLR
jgi:hypothetical protein